MAEILQLRHEAAQLVGFANFAEYSLATKMAHETGEVLDFLRRLARSAGRRRSASSMSCRRSPAARSNAWDVAFYSERLKRERLQVSEEELRPVLPAHARARRVVRGCFAPVRHPHRDAQRRRDLPPGRALLRHPRARRHAARRLLPRPVRAAEQAQRRVDGRVRRTHAARAGRGAARRLPGLQLHAAGRRETHAAHARRRADAVPRIRPRPASHADARRLPERRAASTACRGTRWNCPASSWRTSRGARKCCR